MNLSANVLPDFPMCSSSVHPATLVSIYDPTFLQDLVSVLRVYKEILGGSAYLKVHLNAMFATDVFAPFSLSFDIRHHYVRFPDVRIWVVPNVLGTFVGSAGFDIGPI